jgi:hypothetical protein
MLLGEIVSDEPAVSSKPLDVVTLELPINTEAVLVDKALNYNTVSHSYR